MPNKIQKYVLYFSYDGNITCINSAQEIPQLREIVKIIGELKLGFTKNDFGLHYIQSRGAISMFLSGTATIIIMQIGL